MFGVVIVPSKLWLLLTRKPKETKKNPYRSLRPDPLVGKPPSVHLSRACCRIHVVRQRSLKFFQIRRGFRMCWVVGIVKHVNPTHVVQVIGPKFSSTPLDLKGHRRPQCPLPPQSKRKGCAPILVTPDPWKPALTFCADLAKGFLDSIAFDPLGIVPKHRHPCCQKGHQTSLGVAHDVVSEIDLRGE